MQANQTIETPSHVLVGTRAAAQHLGITGRELKWLRKSKKITFYRIGHRTVSYAVKDLDAFLASCRVAGNAGNGKDLRP